MTQAFHVGEYVFDEMRARGWTQEELAERMGGDWRVNYLCLDFMKAEHPDLILGSEMAAGLARAFGTTVTVWLNLDKAWREHPTIVAKRKAKQP